jgi:branched-chain amino acid transport system substrate-binding protein
VAMDATPPAADQVTKDDVLAAYYALEGETLDGLLPGPVTFTEGDGPQPGMPCGFPISFADGEFTTTTYGDESGNGATGDLQSFCGGDGGAG